MEAAKSSSNISISIVGQAARELSSQSSTDTSSGGGGGGGGGGGNNSSSKRRKEKEELQANVLNPPLQINIDGIAPCPVAVVVVIDASEHMWL
ncbi:hypothetical protein TYRP_010153 [Tyrophagus putrescentiae]|nr:hypothetical protein TYRP_010153 [Tyrophagus putrescentiae]